MHLSFLGTACGTPSLTRYHASVIFTSDNASYMLDCGEPCAISLWRSGIDPLSVRALFVTHAHADHITGMPMVLRLMHVCGRREPFAVYLPPSAIDVITSYLNLLGLGPTSLQFALRILPIQEGVLYDDGDLSLTAHRTLHQPDSYAFVLRSDGKAVVYSGDIKTPAEIADLYSNVEVGIMELAHFPPEAIVEGLRDRRIGTLVITHLHYRRQGKELERQLLQTLQKGMGGVPVRIARDGMVVSV